MPHMSSGGSEDFYSTDEVKVYKEEGNKDEEKRSSENLSEEKLGLVTESEKGKNSTTYHPSDKVNGSGINDGKVADTDSSTPGKDFGPLHPFFLTSPFSPYTNGQGKYAGVVQPLFPGLVYNDFAQPPPAHMGIPPVHTDPKTGLPRPSSSVYAAYPHTHFPSLYGPDFPPVPWHRPTGYPMTTGAFTASYPPMSQYGHPALIPGLSHPSMPHHGLLSVHKSDIITRLQDESFRMERLDDHNQVKMSAQEKRRNYVKKPLNAFMLFMKEMRPRVIAECTLRESSAINQILGRRWHALDRTEQAKYYDMARKEKDLHTQLYPSWSARDNYAAHQKKKKRKKSEQQSVMSPDSKLQLGECPNAKKCRARYGMDQQQHWCKPCRRKKKCIRYMGEDGGGSVDGDDDDDSSRMGSHVSTCDTDSLQDMEVDSPHHSTLHHPHSPLSPIVSGEAGVEDRRREMKMVVDTTSRMGLDSGLESFPRCKIQDTSLPLSSVPFSGSIMSSPLPNFVQGDTRAVSYTPVKGGHCDSVTTHCSPQVVAT